MRSSHRRIFIDIGDHASEAMQGVLLDEGALGIEVIDDDTRAVPGEAHTPTGRARVIGTFERQDGLESRISKAITPIVGYFENAAPLEVQWQDLEDQDWNQKFKESWQPLQLCESVWIAPSWSEDFEAPDNAHVLWMDPGVAFGTGTHETTQLCAHALEKQIRTRAVHKKARLLDVGTGTGVLAMVALKLGIKHVHGTDIDPRAIEIALENAERNGVDKNISARVEAPDESGTYDACVANILAEPLMALAPAIAQACKKNAPLWLSGLLETQENMVREAYEGVGFRFLQKEQKGQWLRLDLVRS